MLLQQPRGTVYCLYVFEYVYSDANKHANKHAFMMYAV